MLTQEYKMSIFKSLNTAEMLFNKQPDLQCLEQQPLSARSETFNCSRINTAVIQLEQNTPDDEASEEKTNRAYNYKRLRAV
jgi:hypothetical protein